MLAISTLDVLCCPENSVHCVSQDGDTTLDLFLADDKWRDKSEGVGSTGDDEQTALTGSGDDWCWVLGQLHTEDQAASSDFLNDIWETLLELLEMLAEDLFLLEDTLLEVRLG